MSNATGISNALYERSRQNAAMLHNLPDEPDCGWHGHPFPNNKYIKRFESVGFIAKIGICQNEHELCNNTHNCDTRIWRLTETGEKILDRLDKPNTLPCGHQGIRTLVPREAYTCLNENCNKEFDYETAKSVEL